MFDWLKKSKREQIRDNARQGRDGEDRIRNEYEWSGYEVKRTGRGHDLKASKRDWLTGKKNTKYIEVKTGNSKLSPLQKKKKKQFGRKYVVERLETTPFGFTSPNDSIWGTSSTTKRKKPRTKKRSKARTPKRRKSSSIADSIWGTSSSSRRKRSTSIW